MAITEKLTSIADAIRSKTGETATMTLADMPTKISGISGTENVEWHQCPELVRNFIANVTYDSADYTTSSIETYADGTTVSTNPIGVTAGSETYYNQVPNTQTPFANSTKSGTLKPLDQIRWIKSPTRNARDLGGWACDGGTVKYGKLIRGGEVYASDTDYIKTLHDEVGIRAELELQGTDVTEDYSVIGSDVDFCCPKSDGAWWAYYYLTEYPTSMKQAFRFIFDSVKRGRPLYYHCSAGADRTGTISCLIEAILGVSQSDIDKDYELTSFNGADYLRKRSGRDVNGTTEHYWKNLITAINALTVGSTFRDKVINFIASLGFTADEINEFRAAMIDGTPETVTPVISTYTVTNTLANVTNSNSAASATQYQPYTASITPNEGYVISNIKVTMGGTVVTQSVWDGHETNLYRTVKTTLTGCSSDNESRKVIDGQGYAATITATDGYTLEGATITITMGGVDMSAYYKDGTIAIPKVTGDIVIEVTAVEQSDSNLFDFDSATAYKGAGTAWASASDASSDGYKQDDMLVSVRVRNNNMLVWSCDTLKNLPVGTYTFSGEFKQDTAGTSAIAVYGALSSTRLIKNSLAVGNTWTAFSYDFNIETVQDQIYISGQNDNTTSGLAYLRNVKIVAK